MSNHWHYQLMRHTDDNGEEYFAIHEYYQLDGGGGGWTEAPVDVVGDTIEEVKEVLQMMLEDIEKHGVKDYD